VEANLYGCELDVKAYKVAHHLYPSANLEHQDIRLYAPTIRLDYVVGNPPFNLDWWVETDTEIRSQLYYCTKAANMLKPYGILALIVPLSFLADAFSDSGMIKAVEKDFGFLGQIQLPDNAFTGMGVDHFPTKLMFWQKKSDAEGYEAQPYNPELRLRLMPRFHVKEAAGQLHDQFLSNAKAALEKNKHHMVGAT
jgi:type I restriction-modification system DNA methylase subunit